MTVGPHLLGRTRPPDTAHLRAWSLAAAAPPQGIEVEIKRPTLSDYDQGETPECVAYSISRIVNWFNGYAFDAPWLYARCKELDGDPTGDGTNARAACDVLRTLGHVRMIAGKDVKSGASAPHTANASASAQSADATLRMRHRPGLE